MSTKLPRNFVSAASLNLLRNCSRCFWLELVKGIKRPAGAFSTLPSRFDGMIKAYCRPYHGNDTLPPILQRAGLTGRLVDPSLKTWQDPATGLKLRGYLDECLQNPDGTFSPLDHKTRGKQPESVHHTYQVQLDIYSLLLQRNDYPISGQGILVYYSYAESDLNSGISLSVSSYILATQPESALTLVQTAAKILTLDNPPLPSRRCSYCYWVATAGHLVKEFN